MDDQLETKQTKQKIWKTKIKSLPNNFFEELIFSEAELHEDFSVEKLQKVTNSISEAIEYYESREDRRYEDYQLRLKNLLSDPIIIKKMSEYYKFESQVIDNKTREKQRILLQVQLRNKENTYSSNETNVKSLIHSIEENEKNTKSMLSFNSLIKNNFTNQKESLMEKLERRKEKRLSSHNENIYVNVDEKEGKEGKILSPLRQKINKKSLVININPENYNENDNENLNEDVNNIENNENNENNESIHHKSSLYNSKNTSKKSSLLIKDTFNSSSSIYQNHPLASKYKDLIINSTNNLKTYLLEVNEYFYTHLFQRFSDNIKSIYAQRLKKYMETTRIYHSQIKEMEFIQSEDSNHSESLTEIIKSLKEEKDEEIEKMNLHYETIIEDAVNEFKSYGIVNNSGVQLLEEKFKLDITNLINEFVLPKIEG